MPSLLFNEPLPDHHVHRYDLMARDALTPDEDIRELKARAYYLDRAAAGDHDAKLMLKVHPRWRLTGWFNRDKGGDILGELSQVVREREGK